MQLCWKCKFWILQNREMAREITHETAQSMHEYVWRVKWDQGERNGWLGRSNSHPPDCELYLKSRLPTHWRTCKLPHCAIDPDVAFWYDYLSPAWMHRGERGDLSLGDTRQETSLGVGLLKKIVASKKEFIGRSYENCYFQHRNSAVPLSIKKMTHRQHLKLIPCVQLQETLSVTDEAYYFDKKTNRCALLLKKGVRQMSGREYWWVPKTLMSARDKIPCTVSCTNRRKQLQMSEQELTMQPEVSRSTWSKRKE